MTIEELKNEAIQKANELTEKMLKDHKKKLDAIKEEYDEKIAKLQEEPKTGRRWKPENEEEYYYLSEHGEIIVAFWDNYLIDNDRYAIGNCFKTKEEAEFMVEKLKVLVELKEYADDEQEWEYDNCHWHIGYNPNTECIKVGYFIFTKSIPFNIYFSSEEQAQKCIDAIGEERLKKYYFCVEE